VTIVYIIYILFRYNIIIIFFGPRCLIQTIHSVNNNIRSRKFVLIGLLYIVMYTNDVNEDDRYTRKTLGPR